MSVHVKPVGEVENDTIELLGVTRFVADGNDEIDSGRALQRIQNDLHGLGDVTRPAARWDAPEPLERY